MFLLFTDENNINVLIGLNKLHTMINIVFDNLVCLNLNDNYSYFLSRKESTPPFLGEITA
ncbi:unnamed protein product [marine sediment metagenome]|uniref:Uncharacterized protein n=1 Tax=marine sediment metagenome TaxID=412755 RepID=X1E7V7_9ZZZZ